MTLAKVAARTRDRSLERDVLARVGNAAALHRVPQRRVIMLVRGVEIAAQSPGEERRVLAESVRQSKSKAESRSKSQTCGTSVMRERIASRFVSLSLRPSIVMLPSEVRMKRSSARAEVDEASV